MRIFSAFTCKIYLKSRGMMENIKRYNCHFKILIINFYFALASAFVYKVGWNQIKTGLCIIVRCSEIIFRVLPQLK